MYMHSPDRWGYVAMLPVMHSYEVTIILLLKKCMYVRNITLGYWLIKTHGSESWGQGGSSKWCPNGLEAYTCQEYFTGKRV